MLSLKILKTSLDGFSPDVSLKSKIGPWTYFCYCGLTPLVISFFIWIYLIYFLTLVIFLFISSSRCFSYSVVLIYIFCCYCLCFIDSLGTTHYWICSNQTPLSFFWTQTAILKPFSYASSSELNDVHECDCMILRYSASQIAILRHRHGPLLTHNKHQYVKQPDQHLQSHAYSLSRYPSGFFLALHCFYVVYLNKWPWSILTEPVCCNMRSRLPM